MKPWLSARSLGKGERLSSAEVKVGRNFRANGRIVYIRANFVPSLGHPKGWNDGAADWKIPTLCFSFPKQLFLVSIIHLHLYSISRSFYCGSFYQHFALVVLSKIWNRRFYFLQFQLMSFGVVKNLQQWKCVSPSLCIGYRKWIYLHHYVLIWCRKWFYFANEKIREC